MEIALNASNWQTVASDGVQAEIKNVRHNGRDAMRLDFTFNGAGHAIARLPLALQLPDNYAFAFDVSGECRPNTLEFKLIDDSGDNVWWVNRPNFHFRQEWTTLCNKRRHVSYAWGPDRNHPASIAHIELVVTASSGGSGSVYFSNFSFTALPLVGDEIAEPTARASSQGDSAQAVLDLDSKDEWRSSGQGAQWLVVDFNQVREFGGLIIDWGDNFAVSYDVEAQLEGKRWKVVRSIRHGVGGRDYIYMPECEASAVRIKMRKPGHRDSGYAIKSIAVQPLEFGSSMNAYLRAVAQDKGVGCFPRYFLDEHSYFTVVGASGDTQNALLGEEGGIEIGAGKPAVEPFIFSDGRLLTWGDAVHQQVLEEGFLPIPSVVRRHSGLELMITTWVTGEPGSSVLYVKYAIENTDSRKRDGKLFLSVRPLQVNPPWQFLNTPGGFTPIKSLKRDKDAIVINDEMRIYSLTRADGWGATSLERGNLSRHLSLGDVPKLSAVTDELGLASGAFGYNFSLAPGKKKIVYLVVPLHTANQKQAHTACLSDALPAAEAASPADASTKYDLRCAFTAPEEAFAQTKKWWQDKLARIHVQMPFVATDLVNTIKSQAAYILINRHGKGIQPGSRSYRRTWIRDGALTSAALLQLGYAEEVKDFIEWFAPFQYANGKVPCCVDRRGADPTPEHDSHGEFIYLIAEYFRFTGDRELLRKLFSNVLGAVAYIDSLRKMRMTDEYKKPENRHLFGIMPESISHEGYSAKPAHSNWDNLWTLKGLKDAVVIAEALGETKEAARLSVLRDEFRCDLLASIAASMKKHHISYIPGAADLGDFDATSTTIGLDPAQDLIMLKDALNATFEQYWDFFLRRRDGKVKWEAYTPYELRSVGAFLRLGKARQAHELLDYFMNDRRPAAWNHWGEVVWNDPLTPKFIGDAPHTWVGSDFLRAVRNMFAYEEDNGRLIVGAGIKKEWLFEGVSVVLPTHFGTLELVSHGYANKLAVSLSGSVSKPIVLRLPVCSHNIEVNGVSIDRSCEVVIDALPARVNVDMS
jgi:hypothetical protein